MYKGGCIHLQKASHNKTVSSWGSERSEHTEPAFIFSFSLHQSNQLRLMRWLWCSRDWETFWQLCLWRRFTCSNATSTGHVRLTVAISRSLSRSPHPVKQWNSLLAKNCIEKIIGLCIYHHIIINFNNVFDHQWITKDLAKKGMCKVNEAPCQLGLEARCFLVFLQGERNGFVFSSSLSGKKKSLRFPGAAAQWGGLRGWLVEPHCNCSSGCSSCNNFNRPHKRDLLLAFPHPFLIISTLLQNCRISNKLNLQFLFSQKTFFLTQTHFY